MRAPCLPVFWATAVSAAVQGYHYASSADLSPMDATLPWRTQYPTESFSTAPFSTLTVIITISSTPQTTPYGADTCQLTATTTTSTWLTLTTTTTLSSTQTSATASLPTYTSFSETAPTSVVSPSYSSPSPSSTPTTTSSYPYSWSSYNTTLTSAPSSATSSAPTTYPWSTSATSPVFQGAGTALRDGWNRALAKVAAAGVAVMVLAPALVL